MNEQNDIASRNYWEDVYAEGITPRLPSGLSVSVRNFRRLLTSYMKGSNQKILEIGCAPGHMLCWAAMTFSCDAYGIDYSPNGIAATQKLFDHFKQNASLFCEDVLSHQSLLNTLDLVYSNGVIEHFMDPAPIVQKHIDLLKPGGTAIISIPNYNSIYGSLQRYFDPDSLTIHNLAIMSPDALLALIPENLRPNARAFYYGRMIPGLVWFYKKWPLMLSKGIAYLINLLGLLQPFDIRHLCPQIVMEIKKP